MDSAFEFYFPHSYVWFDQWMHATTTSLSCLLAADFEKVLEGLAAAAAIVTRAS